MHLRRLSYQYHRDVWWAPMLTAEEVLTQLERCFVLQKGGEEKKEGGVREHG